MELALLVFIGPDSIFACVKVLPKADKHPGIYNRVNNWNAGMNGYKLQQRSTESSTSLQRQRPVREWQVGHAMLGGTPSADASFHDYSHPADL